ncbi:MAG: protein-glutamate O-methyltransferase CheR [Candidatus Cloacimonetes bacterium]|nr:protein-glutamate O-methyltransferase CheR [Candidatus Cloacimonadota bacterium]
MVAPLSPTEYTNISTLLEKTCGIHLEPNKDYLLETRLSDLAIQEGCDTFGQLYQKIQSNRVTLLPKVIDLMTTNETYWFRDDRLWNYLRETLVPQLLEDLASGKKSSLRIWSAAASTGQEAYSFNILIHDYLNKIGKQYLLSKISIIGTDVSSTALFLAKTARYNSFSMNRGLTEDQKNKYFTKVKPTTWKLNDELKKQIEFKTFNLMDPFTSFGEFDLILCRNVLIYFSKACKTEIMKKFSKRLHLDGTFILGSSETTLGYSNSFKTQNNNGAIVYKLNQ